VDSVFNFISSSEISPSLAGAGPHGQQVKSLLGLIASINQNGMDSHNLLSFESYIVKHSIDLLDELEAVTMKAEEEITKANEEKAKEEARRRVIEKDICIFVCVCKCVYVYGAIWILNEMRNVGDVSFLS